MPQTKDTVVNYCASSGDIEYVHKQVIELVGWLTFQNPQLMVAAHGLKLYLINELYLFVTDGHFGVLLVEEPADTEDAFNQFLAARKAYAFEPK